MKITLDKLSITNFKGIKDLEINFKHITDIFGENAAGKTSVFDAFTWLFFGKDSTDRKDFELKPLDKNGKIIPKVDVEVSATINADGKQIDIRRVQREKWVKKRGELTSEFAGNETLYYWNDVPLQQKQFSDKINDLLNENIFKLITNTLYYNSLKWQERRSILLQIAGEISNADLVSANPDFKSLISMLGDKTLEEFKREVAVKKKKIKDDLATIPTRIAEINHNMPESLDFIQLKKELESKKEELDTIDAALQDSMKQLQVHFDELSKKQTHLHELKSKAANLKNDIRGKFADAHQERKNKIAGIERELSSTNSSIDDIAFRVSGINREIERLDNEKYKLVKEWDTENAKQLVFNENDFVCPTCERPLDEKKIESSKENLKENFNSSKAKNLASIEQKGGELKSRIESFQADVKDKEQQLIDLNKKFVDLGKTLSESKQEHEKITANSETEYNLDLQKNKEYTDCLFEIANLEKELEIPADQRDNTELKVKKAMVNIDLDAIKKQLNHEDTIRQLNTRIEELQTNETILAQQLADLEGKEFLAEQFTRAKMDTLVNRINGRFKYVTFKLFDTQINGAEVECCDTLVNGVPFSDANNAARINAGIDIINTLCEHYGVYAPIFIDNRESVNDLIECNSQIVNLIVSKDKKLRVA
jgi:DNA repair exonuclease SbcCD ATPase subunit